MVSKNKKIFTCFMGVLLCYSLSISQLKAQQVREYSTDAGILRHNISTEKLSFKWIKHRDFDRAAWPGNDLRGYNGKMKYLWPFYSDYIKDTCGFFNPVNQTFYKAIPSKYAYNSIAFNISENEIAIVFTQRKKWHGFLYPENSNGLFFDIFNEATGSMLFGNNGNEMLKGAFDQYASNTIDIFQKPNKNYEYWILAHNQDSICVFSFSRDTVYLNDVYRKAATEHFIDANDRVGLNAFAYNHDRDLLFSNTGKFIVYKSDNQNLTLKNPELVNSHYNSFLKIFGFNPHTGNIGKMNVLDEDDFIDDVKFNAETRPYFNSGYNAIFQGKPVFTKCDSFLYIKKVWIEAHPENTAPDIEKLRIFKRYPILNQQKNIDTVQIEKLGNSYITSQMIFDYGKMYYIRDYNHWSKLEKHERPNSNNPDDLILDTTTILRSPQFYGSRFEKLFEQKYYLDLVFENTDCLTDTIRIINKSHTYFTNFEWRIAYGGQILLRDTASKQISFVPPHGGSYKLTLTASRTNGETKTIDTTLHIISPPKAAIASTKKTGCAFNEITFRDSSRSDTINAATGASWLWQFKRNDTLIKTELAQNPKVVFTKAGMYAVSLVYSNGFCTDTALLSDSIYILPAPKPGFSVSDTLLCAPAEIEVSDSSSGQVISRLFTTNRGDSFNTLNGHITFDSAGIYKITQTLTGPTGCITKDSQWVRIRPEFTKNDSTQLLFASVLDSQRILLKWKTNPNAMGYSIERSAQMQNSLTKDIMSPLQDSIIDTVPQATMRASYQYTLKMRDSCFNFSATSNTAQTIVLSRKNYNNEYLVLNWNAYETWQNGVKEYVIESSENNNNWLPIDASGQLTYRDYRLAQLKSDTVYYRIKAIEQDGNLQYSYSNVVKVPLSTTLFIPNAFSPNNDGINDVFKVGHFGLKNFECKIYSKTGQIVAYSTNPNEIWDGTFNEEDYQMGNYRYIITATDIKGKELRYDGTLLLLR